MRKYCLSLTLALMAPLAARANIIDWSFTGQTVVGTVNNQPAYGTVSGNFTIDTATDAITSYNYATSGGVPANTLPNSAPQTYNPLNVYLSGNCNSNCSAGGSVYAQFNTANEDEVYLNDGSVNIAAYAPLNYFNGGGPSTFSFPNTGAYTLKLQGLYYLGYTNAAYGGVYSSTYTEVSNSPSTVPLPAAAWLLLSGLGGLGAMARKRIAP